MGEIYEAVFTVQAGWAHAGRLISRRRPGAAMNRRGRPLAILLRPTADDAPCMCPPGLMKVYHHTPRERLPAPDTERTFGGDSRAGNLGWACSRRHGSPQPTTTLTTSGWDDRNDAGKPGDGTERASDGGWGLGSGRTVLVGYVHRSPSNLDNGGLGRVPACGGQIYACGIFAGPWAVVALWVGRAAQRGVYLGCAMVRWVSSPKERGADRGLDWIAVASRRLCSWR